VGRVSDLPGQLKAAIGSAAARDDGIHPDPVLGFRTEVSKSRKEGWL
jgi:hypothetical protein